MTGVKHHTAVVGGDTLTPTMWNEGHDITADVDFSNYSILNAKIDAPLITSGNLSVNRMPLGGDWDLSSELGIYKDSGLFKIGKTGVGPKFEINHATGKIEMGVADADLITTGTLDIARIPNVSVSDVTTSRALDTEYQNTCGRAILAIVTVDFQRTDLASVTANPLIGSSSPPDTSMGLIGLAAVAAGENEELMQNVIFVVPNNYYYKIATSITGTGSGNISLGKWFEVEL